MKLVCQGVLLVGENCPEFLQFLSFYPKNSPTIGVGMFIALERISGPSKVDARMFITLDGPAKAHEGIAVIIECDALTEAVLGISYPAGIPPKPPEVVAISIISARGEHF